MRLRHQMEDGSWDSQAQGTWCKQQQDLKSSEAPSWKAQETPIILQACSESQHPAAMCDGANSQMVGLQPKKWQNSISVVLCSSDELWFIVFAVYFCHRLGLKSSFTSGHLQLAICGAMGLGDISRRLLKTDWKVTVWTMPLWSPVPGEALPEGWFYFASVAQRWIFMELWEESVLKLVKTNEQKRRITFNPNWFPDDVPCSCTRLAPLN